MSVDKRFLSYIDKVASSKAEFSKRTGISAVILSHINSGRNKVSLKAVSQLLKAYPQISADYLLMGSGKPFKETEDEWLNSLHARLNQYRDSRKLEHQKEIEQLKSLLNQIQAKT
ncbi:MAG: hypothetical protein JXR19_02090 [Bacteroidia bacterium]